MKTVIFDVDGVLVDSSALTIQIISGLLKTLERCPGSQPERICETFGMSITDMWNYLMPGCTWSEQKKMSDAYDEQIVEALKDVSVLLPGVRKVLTQLRDAGYRLTVASNCGIRYMDAVLDSQNIREFFVCPQCLQSVHGTEKADILKWHLREHSGTFVMAGDRRSDVQAAHKAGIPCIGVRSAFGSKSELEEADMWIQNVEQLPAAVQRVLTAKKGTEEK